MVLKTQNNKHQREFLDVCNLLDWYAMFGLAFNP